MVSNSGSQRDYHTIDVVDNPPDRASVESRLSNIESQQNVVLNDVLQNPEIASRRHDELVDFVVLMYHRTPPFKEAIEQQLSSTVKATARLMLRNGRFPPPPDSVKKLIQERGDDIFEIEINNWKLLEMMFDNAAHSQMRGILRSMKWRIRKVEAPNVSLVTSDTPVVLFDRDHDPKSPYGKGFACPSVEVSLPLSGQLLLEFSHSGFDDDGTLTPELVRHYNRRMIIASSRFIFGPTASEELLADIPALCSQKAGFSFSTIDFPKGSYFISKITPVTNEHLRICQP